MKYDFGIALRWMIASIVIDSVTDLHRRDVTRVTCIPHLEEPYLLKICQRGYRIDYWCIYSTKRRINPKKITESILPFRFRRKTILKNAFQIKWPDSANLRFSLSINFLSLKSSDTLPDLVLPILFHSSRVCIQTHKALLSSDTKLLTLNKSFGSDHI
jgi:hypothetical protein